MKSLRLTIRVLVGVGVGASSFVLWLLFLFSVLYRPEGATTEFPLYSILLGKWTLTMKGQAFALIATLFGALAGSVPMAILTARQLTRDGLLGRLARLWVVIVAGTTLWLCVDWKDQETEQKIAAFRQRPTLTQNTELILAGLQHNGSSVRGPFDSLPAYETLKEDEAYLLEHKQEIEAFYEAAAPARAWMDEISRLPEFDDLVVKAGSPILDFRHIRSVSINQLQHAVLAANEGDLASALEEFHHVLAFSRTLKNGSHCLVHFMIAVVVEKAVFRNALAVVDKHPDAAGRGFESLLASTRPEKTLPEVLKDDALCLTEAMERVNGEFAAPLRPFAPLVWHPSETETILLSLYKAAATPLKNSSQPSVAMSAEPKPLPERVHYRNMIGYRFAEHSVPATGKLVENIQALEDLKRQLLQKLTSAPGAAGTTGTDERPSDQVTPKH